MTQSSFEREQAAERRVGQTAFLVNTAIVLIIWVISSTSILTRWEILDISKPWFMPWIEEGTSPLVVIPLFFLVRWFERRAPIGQSDWRYALAVHSGGAVMFCTLVIIWMALFRGLVWPPVFGEQYDLFGDAPVQVFIYEFRKLLPGYLGPLVFIYFSRQLEIARLERDAAREEARQTHRLTLKCGGRTIFVDAADVLTARAAGNYVEVKLQSGHQLARLTLAELERQLAEAGIEIVRVHRSWLVNRAAIASVKPTGEGDVTITLTNGDEVPGSRRYREALAA